MNIRRSRLPVIDQPAAPGLDAPVSERKDAARNRERILEATLALLKERPMGEICMDAVAEKAGVGKGTLYRRFKDRSALCMALLDENTRKWQQATIAGLGLSRDSCPSARLRAFVTSLVRFTCDHAELLREARTWSRPQALLQHPAHTWILYELRRCLETCGHGGLHASLLAEWVFTVVDPNVILSQRAAGHSVQAVTESLERFIFSGVSIEALSPKSGTDSPQRSPGTQRGTVIF
jgi:AcrR family transcriptional regulator